MVSPLCIICDPGIYIWMSSGSFTPFVSLTTVPRATFFCCGEAETEVLKNHPLGCGRKNLPGAFSGLFSVLWLRSPWALGKGGREARKGGWKGLRGCTGQQVEVRRLMWDGMGPSPVAWMEPNEQLGISSCVLNFRGDTQDSTILRALSCSAIRAS